MLKKIFLLTIIFLFFNLQAVTALAFTYKLPRSGNDVVGRIRYAFSQPGETLADVGRRFDIGYFEMIEANPHISPKRRLASWSKVMIPSRFVLPPSPHEGIVINLAELRLYYFPKSKKIVITEPVGIGKVGWMTPLGATKIIEKLKDPVWRPPVSVREEAARQGYIIPKVWPPGPDNPLGKFAMRLGWPMYLIHGTNHPEGVGKRSSAGCIRMYPEDIARLFPKVPVGTIVRVINKPIKVGWDKNELLIESHKPLKEKGKYVTDDAINLVSDVYVVAKRRDGLIRWRDVKYAMQSQTGIPLVIGTTAASAKLVVSPEPRAGL